MTLILSWVILNFIIIKEGKMDSIFVRIFQRNKTIGDTYININVFIYDKN